MRSIRHHSVRKARAGWWYVEQYKPDRFARGGWRTRRVWFPCRWMAEAWRPER